jgi:hypothetical protein
MRCLASEQHLSLRMGFLLYGMALEPICVDANGSSISFRLAKSRMSVHICGGKSTERRM